MLFPKINTLKQADQISLIVWESCLKYRYPKPSYGGSKISRYVMGPQNQSF